MPKQKPANRNGRARQAGLTLLEVLIAMAIMGVIMLAFVQLFGGSLQATSSISARNELLSEGQIAQQLIVAKLKQASFVYPPGTTLTMTQTIRTRNTVGGNDKQTWTVGADPILAMILPPKGSDNPSVTTCSGATQDNRDMCFVFYAYYPIRRGAFIDGVSSESAPNPDPANEDTWLLMEYRKAYTRQNVDRSNNRLASPPSPNDVLSDLGRGTGRILVDYVQPPGNGEPQLFNFNADGSVDLNVQMGREQQGKPLELPPLTVRAYPRNALP